MKEYERRIARCSELEGEVAELKAKLDKAQLDLKSLRGDFSAGKQAVSRRTVVSEDGRCC